MISTKGCFFFADDLLLFFIASKVLPTNRPVHRTAAANHRVQQVDARWLT
jgi:hypothetical protein